MMLAMSESFAVAVAGVVATVVVAAAAAAVVDATEDCGVVASGDVGGRVPAVLEVVAVVPIAGVSGLGFVLAELVDESRVGCGFRNSGWCGVLVLLGTVVEEGLLLLPSWSC